MLKPCVSCGTLLDHGSRCPACTPHRPRTTPNRTGHRQAAFRQAVLDQADHRCQAMVNGERCPITGDHLLEAHHLDPLRDTGRNDPARGVAVCRRHHHLIEARQNPDRTP